MTLLMFPILRARLSFILVKLMRTRSVVTHHKFGEYHKFGESTSFGKQCITLNEQIPFSTTNILTNVVSYSNS